MKGLFRVAALLSLLAGILILVGGCTNYYKVTDPHSGNVYYTTKIEKNKKDSAVKLTDERSGNMVTIQNSEVKEISKDEYNVGVYPPPPDNDKKE